MKTILTILLFVGVTATGFGQGTVNWTGLIPTAITAQTNATQFYPLYGGGISGFGTVGNTAPAGSGFTYYFELLYMPGTGNGSFTGAQVAAPDFASLFSGAWQDTGLMATNSAVAGRLAPVNSNAAATVPWASGVTNNIILVGWSANLGTTWLAASNTLANWETFGAGSLSGIAFFGESETGYISPFSSSPGAAVFGGSPTAAGLPINSPDMQLYLMPIPEPTTIALAGLGGLALLAFRRRK